MTENIIIEEVGAGVKRKSAAPAPEKTFDLQDYLLAAGLLFANAAAIVTWWPAALIIDSLFCFAFSVLIQIARSKEKK